MIAVLSVIIFVLAIPLWRQARRSRIDYHALGGKSTRAKGYWWGGHDGALYYTPPRDVSCAQVLSFYYHDVGGYVDGFVGEREQRVMGAFLYIREQKGLITIHEKKQGRWGMAESISFSLTAMSGDDDADECLDAQYLAYYMAGETQKTISVGEQDRLAVQALIARIDKDVEVMGRYHRMGYWYRWKHPVRGVLGDRTVLTPRGHEVYAHLRGLSRYLYTVERRVLEQELRHDPDYLTMMVPWMIGFGLDSFRSDLIDNIYEYT